MKNKTHPLDVASSLENATLTDLYGICHAALSVLHIELAGTPNNMELLPLQCSRAPRERCNKSHMDKMADLYAKSRDKVVSHEIDHFRQICKLQTPRFRKSDCHIQFAVKMSNAAGRLGTHTHTHTHKLL